MQGEIRQRWAMFKRHTLAPAFSLIEVLVVIAVAAVVLSLVIASLASVKKQAKLTKYSAQTQHNATLVVIYAQDNKDLYPIGHRDNKPFEDRNPFICMMDWHIALVEAGLLENSSIADPEWYAKSYFVGDTLSVAMMYDPNLMQPGNTVDPSVARVKYIGQHQVLYPSRKGMLIRRFVGDPANELTKYFCCAHPPFPTVPVASADLGLRTGKLTDFMGGEDGHPWIVDDIGVPVTTTWNGIFAQDW